VYLWCRASAVAASIHGRGPGDGVSQHLQCESNSLRKIRMLKKLLAVLLLTVPMFAITLTNALPSPTGSGGATGTLFLTIAQQVSVVSSCGGGGISNSAISVTLSNGVPQSPPNIYGNDCLTPDGTYYLVVFIDSAGNTFTSKWTMRGTTFDLSKQVVGVIGTINAVPSSSQYVQQPTGTYLYENNTKITGRMGWPEYTFATLPTLTASDAGLIAVVTDAVSNGCIAGSGTTRGVCRWTGTTWEALGGGSGGGGTGVPGGSPGQIQYQINGSTFGGITQCTPTYGAAVTFNAATCKTFLLSASGASTNVTSSTLTNAVAGDTLIILFTQDATTARTLALPSNWDNGCAVGTKLGSKTAILGTYDGTASRVRGWGCSGDDGVIHLVEQAVGAAPSTGMDCVADSGTHTFLCKSSTGSITSTMTNPNYRSCTIVIGATNGTALVAADIAPQVKQCKLPMAGHVLEISVDADAGTSSVQVQKRHCSTITTGACTAWTNTNLLSAELVTLTGGFPNCAKSAISLTCLDGTTSSGTITAAATAIAAGDYLETSTATLTGAPKLYTVTVTWSVD
jgi:hypothetical protein